MKISAKINVYNEEANIAAVCESLEWADEIVVCDSYSTDRTVEIARRYTDKIFFREFHGYKDKHEYSDSVTTGDWILWMDADEIVTPELAEEIRALFADGKEPPCPVYTFELVTKPPVGEPWWHASVVKRNRFCDRRVIRARDHAGTIIHR